MNNYFIIFQKKSNSNFDCALDRKKDLVEGQPTKFKGQGDTNAPHIPEHHKVGFKNGPTKTVDLKDGPTKKAWSKDQQNNFWKFVEVSIQS